MTESKIRFRRASPSALSVLSALACFAVGVMCPSDSCAQLQGWQLTWQDEFDGPVVDGRKWNLINKKNSDNQEKQYYLPEQASIVNGNLRITATNQPLDGKLYRSARLESKLRFGVGRFEARIDLPTSQGMWPAFWLNPSGGNPPWPQGGEIDILENKGAQPLVVSSAYHWQTNPGPCCSQHRYVFENYSATIGREPVNFHEGFHLYAAEWDEDEIRFYVDNVLHFTVTEQADRPIFETPKNIILNLAVGGQFGGDPDGTTQYPQIMDIDYVHVYEKATAVADDYNGDNAIDAADYTVWRDAIATEGSELLNDPTPGVVDDSDYEYWRDHFGEALEGSAAGSSSEVPEPSSQIMLFMSSMTTALPRAKRME